MAAIDKQLAPYADLIQFLQKASPQAYLEVRMTYESEAKRIVTEELKEIIETVRANYLMRTDPHEKSYRTKYMRLVGIFFCFNYSHLGKQAKHNDIECTRRERF